MGRFNRSTCTHDMDVSGIGYMFEYIYTSISNTVNTSNLYVRNLVRKYAKTNHYSIFKIKVKINSNPLQNEITANFIFHLAKDHG